MARCVIVGGAGIGCYQRIRDSLREDDWFVYCDGGLNHQRELGRKPDLIVGDFDSHERPVTDTETIVLPREKDDTDTVYAVKEAIRRGFRDFLLIGAVGERFDHTFGNVSLLLYLDSQGIGSGSKGRLFLVLPAEHQRHRKGNHHPGSKVSAGERGNFLRIPVRYQQRSASGRDRPDLRAGGKTLAGTGLLKS